MCGISGFFDSAARFRSNAGYYTHILNNMRKQLRHRGPDDNGILLFDTCGLAHTRLSIIDLTGGNQPMSRYYDSYGYHIVYNGEIYNCDALRNNLENHGIYPRTHSDTELLLLSFQNLLQN